MKNKTFCFLFFILSLNLFSQDLVFTSEPENLGKNINSPYSELHPIISPDGKLLYFTRDNHPGNSASDDQDIWFSQYQSDGTWSLAANMGTPLNNHGNNSVSGITPDNNMMLLMGKYNYYDGTMSSGVSISTRDKRGWIFPKAQKIDAFENRNDYYSFCISADGNIIVLSVETKKSVGALDLYVSFRSKDGWTTPKNLGKILNTKTDDGTPFLAADSKTLYFCSSGHGGFGDADVFMTKRSDDTWQNWSEPVNMGNKINGVDWDGYFTIPASGDYAYFVSNNKSYGRGDIFRIKLPEEAKPEPVVLISGNVFNLKTKEPVMAEIKYEILPGGEDAGIARTEPNTGEYKIVLPFGKNYGFMAKADRYYAVSDYLDVSDLKEYREIERNLYLAPIAINEVVRLNNIFFESGKSILKEESFPELKRVIDLLIKNPTIDIEISGHTDHAGSDEANLKLSQDRAQSVVGYLIQNGIKSGRLSAKGYGETIPVATNDTDEGRQLNRRVEFRILKT